MKIPFYQTVMKHGRITIPKRIREQFNINDNEFLFVEIQKHSEQSKDAINDAFDNAIH
jgi:AbrB family looped-hinge helix DNA binding protein